MTNRLSAYFRDRPLPDGLAGVDPPTSPPEPASPPRTRSADRAREINPGLVVGELLDTSIRHLVKSPAGSLVEVSVRFYRPEEWEGLPESERSGWSPFRLASGLIQATEVRF